MRRYIYIYIIILIIERMEKWNEKIVKYSRKENVRVRERARARVRGREERVIRKVVIPTVSHASLVINILYIIFLV